MSSIFYWMKRKRPRFAGSIFGTLDIEIEDNRILAGANNHGFDGFIRPRVDFLMRHKWWNEDEIAGAGFGDELEAVAPSEAGASPHDVEDSLKFAMMMRACFCI